MAVSDLIDRVQAIPSGSDIDWRSIREEIFDEWNRKPTLEERIILLQLFNAVMDLIERNVEQHGPTKLREFRNTRLADYKFLIVKEAMIGENVSADRLLEITKREIAAGRMEQDDNLYTLALNGTAVIHPSPEELATIATTPKKKPTFLAKLFGRS